MGYAYNGSDLLSTLTSASGTAYTFTYGAFDRLASVTAGNHTLLTNTYTADRNRRLSQSTYGNGDSLSYAYDSFGRVISRTWEDGDAVAYTYDAWGKLLTTTGTMATTLGADNPLRYRGYVYDEETGLYYLTSRYYNPSWGRFINADIFVSTGQGILGVNMFAYCGNNPVMGYDPDGHWDWRVFWACDTGIPGFSLIAGSSRKADVTPGQLDPRFSIQVATILWSFIGL